MMIRTALVVLALALTPGATMAAGYSLYEQGGRALGFSGAFTARADDASSVFFNPAGLAQVKEGEIYLGTSFIFVSREFAGEAPFPGFGVTEKSPNQVFFPSTFYWAHPISETVGLGFGFYSPFGLATEWEDPEQFSGRFISTRAEITPFYFNPALAVELSPQIRVGGGLMAVHSSVELRRHIAQPNPTDVGPDVLDLGNVQLEGSNNLDFGFNVGLQVDLTDKIVMGATYRSGITVPFEGEADFTFLGSGTALDPQLQPLFPEDQDVSTELPFPAMFIAALGVDITEKVAVEADFGWTQWSDFGSLPLDFEDTSLSSTVEQNWEDAFFIRTGAEIELNPTTDLRLGYYYDETPQILESASPLLADNDRHGLSAGLGYTSGNWRADFFGMVLLISDRSTDGVNRDGYEGTYASGTQILGASFGYRY